MLKIWNWIIKTLWPLVKGFMPVDPSKQNYWNIGKIAGKISKKSKKEIVATLDKKPDRIADKRPPCFVWAGVKRPVKITSNFGYRYLKINGKKKRSFHIGTDYSTWGASEIVAPEDVVIEAVLKKDSKYPCKFKHISGKGWVSAKYPKGRAWTPYAIAIGVHTKARYKFKHVDPSVKAGDKIAAGQKIGVAGTYNIIFTRSSGSYDR